MKATFSRYSVILLKTFSVGLSALKVRRWELSPINLWCLRGVSIVMPLARPRVMCVLTLVDVPGFLPGTSQEFGGVIKHGAKLLYAYGEATVPKVTVITRKAYGGAYCVMAPKHLRGDINYAWPSAQIAVMGAKGATEILHRKDLDDAEKTAAHIADYEDPFRAAELGYIDEVIQPHSTRKRVNRAFALLKDKQLKNPWKKHGNLPL